MRKKSNPQFTQQERILMPKDGHPSTSIDKGGSKYSAAQIASMKN